MREILLTLLMTGIAASALGQSKPRFTLGPVARLDSVSIEGSTGTTAVMGVLGSVRFAKRFAIEADITGAAPGIERSYEGEFVSYVQGPNPTPADIERWSPTARRTLTYAPGIGWSVALAVEGHLTPRLRPSAHVGVFSRRYTRTSTFDILSIPAGIDPEQVARDFRNESHQLTVAGIALGGDVSIALTDRLILTPEVRLHYGAPTVDFVDVGFGIRAGWRF